MELSGLDPIYDLLRSQPLTFQSINYTQKYQDPLPPPYQPSPSAIPEILCPFIQAKTCEEYYILIFMHSIKAKPFIPYLEEEFDGERTLHLVPVPCQMEETLHISQWLPEGCEFHLTCNSTISLTCQTYEFVDLGKWWVDIFLNGYMMYHGLRSNNMPP
ncbi:hypothetical protein Moror_9909 [Moniliophthora roreri MCA 2997]|uniref:Uncharacterized protein n=1 Tax=Moniliophthora roreri (strain MCA 2997) TaxID=1381753 RepID=V2WVT5_MONRO|nr:hypothetical protein Moror_9909 [Moniliophthora roreri MCA 2997]